MNLLPVLLALAAATAACHSQASRPAEAAQAPLLLPTALAPDTTAAVLQLTRQVDLAPAWESGGRAMEGFYGAGNYRMSFYYDSVRRDARQPNVFHVWGRDRYKKVITPFTGTLTITRLAALPDTADIFPTRPASAYTAYAGFMLREDATAHGAGWCQGQAVLDWQVSAQRQAQQAGFGNVDGGEGNPTRGCGLIFQGTWHDNKTGRQQPVAWANSYNAILPEVLAELGLNERMEEVNPKLAKYGWNTIMENDEWWAKSPKPALPL